MDYYGSNLLGAYAGRPHIEAIDDLLDLIESADDFSKRSVELFTTQVIQAVA